MKKNISLILLSLVVIFSLLIASKVFASTCVQSGSTSYCTDTRTGKTTTYNQNGDNIYGSDGSSYTTHGDTTYGSGDVFNFDGNSGSSLPSLTTSGADMNSPEVKAAQARYDTACAHNASGEAIFGGAQANDCREATTEWLQAVAKSQKINSSATQPRSHNSGSSRSKNFNAAEYADRILSDFGYGTSFEDNNTQPENLCVAGGILNSHQEGDYCLCDEGFFQSDVCVPIEQFCSDILGIGGVATSEEECGCETGYFVNHLEQKCYAETSVENTQYKIETPIEAKLTLVNLETKVKKEIETPEVVKIEQEEEVTPRRMTKEEYEAEFLNSEPIIKEGSWLKRIFKRIFR